jgi:hypothetical protein
VNTHAAQASASELAGGVQLRSLAKSFRGPHGPIRAVLSALAIRAYGRDTGRA